MFYHVLFGSKLPFKQKPRRVDASPAAKEFGSFWGARNGGYQLSVPQSISDVF